MSSLSGAQSGVALLAILAGFGCERTKRQQDQNEVKDSGGGLVTMYADEDGDGFGNPRKSYGVPPETPRLSMDNTDCNDNNSEIHPGAPELCNVVDDDCDDEVDDGMETGSIYRDRDGDGFGEPGGPEEGCVDAEGWTTDNTDCDDNLSGIHPGATETCDHSDNDCDGEVDDGLPLTLRYQDADLDGYGDPEVSRSECDSVGWVENGEDCLDNDEGTNPGASERCDNGHDDDCDGLLDCEDDGCATNRNCGEMDCADGLDDDDDGFFDCKDDECWGDMACPGVVASHVLYLGAGRRYRWEQGFWSRSTCGSVSSTMIGENTSVSLHVIDVEGSARVYLPGEDAPRVCAWGLDELSIRSHHVTRRFNGTYTTSVRNVTGARDGFWIAGDCGPTGSGFLPGTETVLNSWAVRYDGGDWSGYSSPIDGSCAHWSSGCDNCNSWGDFGGTKQVQYGYDQGPGARDAVTTSAYGPL